MNLYKVALDNDNIESISIKIKDFFIENGDYVIIENTLNLSDNEILDFYDKLNLLIGKPIQVDLKPNTYELSNNYWSNVKYDFGDDEKQFWRSSNHQNLHTDNSFSLPEYYANLSELVCLKPCEFSGQTTLISNEKLIELIKFLDSKKNTNLFNKILNKNIYFSVNEFKQIKKPILSYDEKNKKYIFNFNYYPAKRAKNTEDDIIIIEELHNFLEEKIMGSSELMDEIKLKRGDCILFNDENVMHGRRSFIGSRYYKKAGILFSPKIDYFKYKEENK
jgi:alpha-ketoglutarate-dependent taurine dioxygenase